MRDKLSIAAFAVSALAFLVVLVSPAPEAPDESAGTRSEGIVNRGQGETNALDEDAKELERLRSRGEALGMKAKKSRPDEDETDKLVAGMIGREIGRRWPAFQNQLKVIRLYEKKPPAEKAPEAKAPEAKAPRKKADEKGAAQEAAAEKTAAKKAAAAKAAAEKAAARKRAARLKAREAAEKRAALLKAREAARKKAAARKAEQDKVEGAGQ
ncbi:MAG: hypothetical protein ACYS9X_03625 [Planctomycetota bacterium]|jgi:colicin import membrane protein